MSTNRHAQIRYNALDKCFSNFGRKFFIEDLLDACNQAIYEFTGSNEGIKKRQLYEDIKYMESSQGWSIELVRLKEGRRISFKYIDKNYSINRSPLTLVEMSQINEVLTTLSRFKGLPQFEWMDEIVQRLQSIKGIPNPKIIDFEQNQFLKGLEFITPLFNAITFKRALQINYLPFHRNDVAVLNIHPYYLKQYNLRWFLFGLNQNFESVTNLALDRIICIKEIDVTYRENREIDFNDYFDDIVGVTIPSNLTLEKILLKIDMSLWPYIKTKPLHGSQRIISRNIDNVIIELNLIVNYELIALLLSLGEKVVVLEPVTLVTLMKEKIHEMIKSY